MDYHSIFAEAISALHAERRYRVFADLERIAGRFPYATWRSDKGARCYALRVEKSTLT